MAPGLGSRIEAALARFIHESARQDPVQSQRHRSFIAAHVLGVMLALVAFAALFDPSQMSLPVGLAWASFLTPLGIAAYLSRTGKLDRAHFLTALNLAAIVWLACALSGGSASFAVVWLVIVPLEAALCANRNVLLGAGATALASFLSLHVATLNGWLPPAIGAPAVTAHLAFICNLAAAGYAFALAANAQRLHRTSQSEIELGRQRYLTVAENASDMITRHDLEGRVLLATRASTEVIGFAPEVIIRDGLGQALEEADRTRLAQLIAAAAEAGSASAEFEIARPGSGGTVDKAWIEMRAKLAEGEATPRSTIVVVTRDITIRKAHEKAMADAHAAAESASKAKSHFIATMSHELRTPLNAIIGFAELLHRELLITNRQPKHARYSRIVHESGEHLLGIVNDLLDASKIEAGQLRIIVEPFDVRRVANGVMETVQPIAAAKSLKLTTEIARDLPEMTADRRAIKQILLNLVSNACKFSLANGNIQMRLRTVGDYIELSVADDGIGIPEDALKRIGNPFFQAEHSYARNFEGTGLGLSIVKGLVELHGGELTIESAVNEGTMVTALIPIDCERSAGSEQTAKRPVLKVVPRRPSVRIAEGTGGPPEGVEIVTAAPAAATNGDGTSDIPAKDSSAA